MGNGFTVASENKLTSPIIKDFPDFSSLYSPIIALSVVSFLKKLIERFGVTAKAIKPFY